MNYLLDINVLSELRRKSPAENVLKWFAQRPSTTMYLSVLTLGEIRKGLAKVQETARSDALSNWLEADVPTFFAGRILSVDANVADRWGRLQAELGRPLPAVDSLLAATALVHNLTVVTRNVKDFAGLGVALIDPWATV